MLYAYPIVIPFPSSVFLLWGKNLFFYSLQNLCCKFNQANIFGVCVWGFVMQRSISWVFFWLKSGCFQILSLSLDLVSLLSRSEILWLLLGMNMRQHWELRPLVTALRMGALVGEGSDRLGGVGVVGRGWGMWVGGRVSFLLVQLFL